MQESLVLSADDSEAHSEDSTAPVLVQVRYLPCANRHSTEIIEVLYYILNFARYTSRVKYSALHLGFIYDQPYNTTLYLILSERN